MGAPKGGKGTKGKGKGKGKGKDAPAKGQGKGGKGKGTAKGGDKPANTAPRWVAVKGTVLVTGASGYLAMTVIRQLMDKNYKVKGTVRSLEGESAEDLKKLFPKLTLIAADLVHSGQDVFEKAMEGCEYVLHTASPFQLAVDDPQKDLIDPAVQGTAKVVAAALKMGVKRCVVTSSVAAVGPPSALIAKLSAPGAKPEAADSDKVWDESDWNSGETIATGPGAYRLSKYLAEKKAWELAEGKDGFLACVNPAFIIGPMLTSRATATSIKLIKDLLEGKLELSGFPFALVDVRDVAKAHISAMEIAEAAGNRFLVCTDKGVHKTQMAEMLRKRFQAYPIPTVGEEFPFVPQFSTKKAQDILKWTARPVEVSLRDMASAAVKHGIVEHRAYKKPVKFGQVSGLNPDSAGFNLLVKVVSVGEAVDLKSGDKSTEVKVGDATGCVTLRLGGDEMADVAAGKVIEVRNATVRMVKGYIRVSVGKWGKVSAHEGGDDVTPKEDKDVSSTEFELVTAH